MRKYRNYTDEDVVKFAKEVFSMANLLRKLNIRPVGGNYAHMRRTLQKLKINTDHWTGQLWSKDKQLKDWSEYTKASTLKPHLIKKRGHVCERCNLTNWLHQPIMLEIDHVDGDRTNNSEENLCLLCPNCHAQTPTWRNRKRAAS